MTIIDSSSILKAAEESKERMTSFLRDIIAIPSESGEEGEVVDRIIIEMEAVDFDEVFVDKIGNVIGRIGSGPNKLVYDSHIDTVGVGDPDSWKFDPFVGKIENGILYGRGASDNKAAIATMVHGAGIMKKLGLTDNCTLYVVGTVMEESCDGMAMQYLLTETLKNIDAVVLGECTNLNIYRGHRGRMELKIDVSGVPCHASAPDRGENAIYKMIPIINGIGKLNLEGLLDDEFLGKGTIAVTDIECKTGSRNTVPDKCTIYIDRRTTVGEDKERCLSELQNIRGAEGAEVSILDYEAKSHTGFPVLYEKYFPTWCLDENHPLVLAGVKTVTEILGNKPEVGRWVFSTNGVSSMGRLGIPTIGFGPGEEKYAHTNEDQIKIDDLVSAIAFYAAFPAYI